MSSFFHSAVFSFLLCLDFGKSLKAGKIKVTELAKKRKADDLPLRLRAWIPDMHRSTWLAEFLVIASYMIENQKETPQEKPK